MPQDTRQPKLNLGCGHRFHPDWVNLDLVPADPRVQQHDLLAGIPFENESVSVVYHSHLLEHLSPTDGRRLIEECFRVLVPGGVLRIVVPDLERIAELYLSRHQAACEGIVDAQADYHWIKLELLDQLVRSKSGGEMGSYINNPRISNLDFVQSRLGSEVQQCMQTKQNRPEPQHRTVAGRVARLWSAIRWQLSRATIRALLGKRYLLAFDEGVFRNQGEIHRWMYDRFSLSELCQAVGFEAPRVYDAFSSQIENFPKYKLDGSSSQVYKPDSLFLECRKPSGKASCPNADSASFINPASNQHRQQVA
jgi:predicted SAM-dependent methyltransferase